MTRFITGRKDLVLNEIVFLSLGNKIAIGERTFTKISLTLKKGPKLTVEQIISVQKEYY